MSQLIDLKPTGLSGFDSELDNPLGTLVTADNVVSDAPGLITARRGFKVYSQGSLGSAPKQLYEYQSKILIHSFNTLQYDDGNGNFTPFVGTYNEPTTGLRMKSLSANGNFYWSTDAGVYKLSAASTSDIASSTIIKSGGVRALDLSANPNFSGSGFLTASSKVAYRVIWGYRDANNNVILGAPSNSITVTNPATSSCYVTLSFIVPSSVTSTSFFYQIYRSPVVSTSGNITINQIAPSDELQLVAENFPQAAELTSKVVIYSDIITEDLRKTGAYLYTNQTSGTGIQSAKLPPPRCEDMALYKQTAFYANTKTQHITTNNLLSVSGFISGRTQLITAENSTSTLINKYTLRGRTQTTKITCVADVANSLNGKYFIISNANNTRSYTIWFKTSGGSTLIPSGIDTLGTIFVQINITTGDVASTVAAAINTVLLTNTYNYDFSSSVNSADLTISNTSNGFSNGVVQGALSTGFTITTLYLGDGESLSNKRPLLSSLSLVSQKIFETSSSFSKAINSNTNESIYSYYDSSADSLPGQFTFSSQNLDSNPFYLGLVTDDLSLSGNFYSAYAPVVKVGSISNASSSIITMPQISVLSSSGMFNSTASNVSVYLGQNGLQSPANVPFGSLNISTGLFSLASHGLQQDQEVLAINPTSTLFAGQPNASVVNTNISTSTGLITSSTNNLQNGQCVRFSPTTTLPRFITVACSSVAADGTFTATSHNFYAGDVIVFEAGGSLPAQFTAGREYFVLNPTTNTFQVSDTPGGTAITTSLTAITTQVSVSQYYIKNMTYNTFNLSRTPNGAVIIPSAQGTGTFTLNLATFFVQTSSTLSFSLSASRGGDAITFSSAGAGSHSFYPTLSLFNNQSINMTTSGTLPIGLSSSNTYYVQNLTTNSFTLSSSINGSQVTFSGTGTGTHTAKVLHGWSTGNTVIVYGSNSLNSIDGKQTITKIDNYSFSIPVNVASSGTYANIFLGSLVSTNQSNKNRLYYSNINEPEAVPALQYFSIGSNTSVIRRIVALSTALFIFTDSGIYRLSGDTSANFTVNLFDTAKILADDSIAVINNMIYCLTTQGVIAVSDGGVSIVSREVEDVFLNVSASQYTTLNTSTFALGYETDRAYIIWVPTSATITGQTEAYRYNIITKNWTRWPISKLAGIVSKTNLIYLSPSDVNAVEVERKALNRTDFVDREYTTESIMSGGYSYDSDSTLYTINVSRIDQMASGDVLLQTIYLSRGKFNQLLTKLNLDTLMCPTYTASTISLVSGTTYKIITSSPTKIVLNDYVNVTTGFGTVSALVTNWVSTTEFDVDMGNIAPYNSGTVQFNYLDTLKVNQFGNLTTAMTNLVSKLNIYDTGYTFSGTTNFITIQTEFNTIIDTLNASSGVTQTDFTPSVGSIQIELLIYSIITSTQQITTYTLNDMFEGSVTILKAIKTEVTFSPVHGGTPNTVKHFRMVQPLFERSTIKQATFSVRSDLDFGYSDISYNSNTSLWGSSPWGEFTWGGVGATSPRFLIPRNKQIARFIYLKFTHSVARSTYNLLGLSVNFEGAGEASWPRGK